VGPFWRLLRRCDTAQRIGAARRGHGVEGCWWRVRHCTRRHTKGPVEDGRTEDDRPQNRREVLEPTRHAALEEALGRLAFFRLGALVR
jgi:hypothetical protein